MSPCPVSIRRVARLFAGPVAPQTSRQLQKQRQEYPASFLSELWSKTGPAKRAVGFKLFADHLKWHHVKRLLLEDPQVESSLSLFLPLYTQSQPPPCTDHIACNSHHAHTTTTITNTHSPPPLQVRHNHHTDHHHPPHKTSGTQYTLNRHSCRCHHHTSSHTLLPSGASGRPTAPELLLLAPGHAPGAEDRAVS